MSSEGREGWGFPAASRKAHYFVIRAGDTFGESLCGRWGFYGGETEQGKDDSPDNCAECRRRLAKRNMALSSLKREREKNEDIPGISRRDQTPG